MLFADIVDAVPPDPTVVDPYFLAMLAGVIIPLVTGFATKITATSATRAVISCALAGLVAALNQVVTAAAWDWRQFTLLLATTFASLVLAYKGLWKPLGGGIDPVSKATPDIGIGPARTDPV